MIIDCERCEGEGVVAGRCLVPASYYQPAEHADETCPDCGGTGLTSTLRSSIPAPGVDVKLAVYLAGVVRRAATRPYVVCSWAPRGFADLGIGPAKVIEAYERRRAIRATRAS